MYNILMILDFHDYKFKIFLLNIFKIIIINNKVHINFIQLLKIFLTLIIILM